MSEKEKIPTERGDGLSAPQAEIVSRTWMAVSFLVEIRKDMEKHLRKSPKRDAAGMAITEGTNALMRASRLLTPTHLEWTSQVDPESLDEAAD